jgi:hypothetical protein
VFHELPFPFLKSPVHAGSGQKGGDSHSGRAQWLKVAFRDGHLKSPVSTHLTSIFAKKYTFGVAERNLKIARIG